MGLTLILGHIHGVPRWSLCFHVKLVGCFESIHRTREFCLEAEDALIGNPSGKIVLASATDVMCFRGNHTILLMAIGIVLPIYLYVLVPYAVCAGDAHYVPSSILFDWKVWEDKNTWWKAAERSATDLHLAFLHPNPREVFRTNILELLAKILLPVVTILLAPTPLCEMIGVTLIGFVMWVTWQQPATTSNHHATRVAAAPGECHDPPGLCGEEDDHSGSGLGAPRWGFGSRVPPLIFPNSPP